jgi:hypothetical protein
MCGFIAGKDLQYSAHRHDYKLFENGNMIDGDDD